MVRKGLSKHHYQAFLNPSTAGFIAEPQISNIAHIWSSCHIIPNKSYKKLLPPFSATSCPSTCKHTSTILCYFRIFKLFVNCVWCHDVCKSPIAGSGVALSERNAVLFYMQKSIFYSRGKLLSIPKEGRWVWQLRMAILFLFFLAALALALSFLTNHSSRTTLSKKAHVVFEHARYWCKAKQQISSLQPRRAARVTDTWLTG